MDLEKAKSRYQQLREQAQTAEFPALVNLYTDILECLKHPNPKICLRERAKQESSRSAALSFRVAVSILD